MPGLDKTLHNMSDVTNLKDICSAWSIVDIILSLSACEPLFHVGHMDQKSSSLMMAMLIRCVLFMCTLHLCPRRYSLTGYINVYEGNDLIAALPPIQYGELLTLVLFWIMTIVGHHWYCRQVYIHDVMVIDDCDSWSDIAHDCILVKGHLGNAKR